MLEVIVPEAEFWDEVNEVFVYSEKQTLILEHSLLSLSKWESKWGKAFLGKQEKTDEEVTDYVRCMTISPDVDPDIYARLTAENYDSITSYIENPMSATKFYDNKPDYGGDTVTSELIYYWMFSLNIPLECQEWHLNRLLTVIRIFGVKNAPPKKLSKSEIMHRNAALNASRRTRLNSNG